MNESPDLRTQVVIIGAGPTGLSLAAQLLRHNIDFIILEKNERTTPLSKAIVVQARTLEIFEELGIATTAIQRGRITTALGMYNKGKKRASVQIAGLGKGLTEFPFALSLEQSKTEHLLAEYLSEHKKNVQWQCEFIRSEEHKDGMTVYYKDADGQQRSVKSLYLVSCEGAHSLVRHQIGAEFEGDTVPRLFYVADVLLSSTVINKDELFIFIIPKGFILFFPMEGAGHYRIVGILPDRTDDNFSFKDIEPHIKETIGSPVTFEELKWFSTYKVHSRMANAFMKGRCFIAGDSAHIHTPAGGQGMNTGIQDGYNLAWKLAYVIRGQLKAEVLETYSTERMHNAKHLLKTTDRMFDIMAGSNPFWNFFRLYIIPRIAGFLTSSPRISKNIFPLISQIGIAYPDGGLTVKSEVGSIQAGDRMPYFILPDGTSSYDTIKEPVFKVLSFGNAKAAPEAFKHLKFPVRALAIPEIPKSLFGSASDFYIVLRPDNYILYLGTTIKACTAVLENISAA